MRERVALAADNLVDVRLAEPLERLPEAQVRNVEAGSTAVINQINGMLWLQLAGPARVVHDGCKRALGAHFTVRPVRDEEEGSSVTVPAGYDAHALRLTGNVVGEGPFRGSLAHRGWRVDEVRLPKLVAGHDSRVLAPAEVELA